ncbi:MAG: signal recognition particle protein [Planctomycetota bacterium]
MFESISKSLDSVFARFKKKGGVLTEENIQEGLREIRQALLEADVNFKVAKGFIKKIQEKAVGAEVLKSVSPGQQLVKVVHDELAILMGEKAAPINLKPGVTVIMMVGLQGSGKTTTCAKLAKLLHKQGRKPLLVAADIQRPAAIEQLRVLGQQLEMPVYTEEGGKPPEICQRGVSQASKEGCDLVILDTAGRLHINDELMQELEQVRRRVAVDETLLVCDAMTGQDAVNSAKEFNERLEVSGVILTKLDGDTRGGAALSIREVTGKPIKFVGIGEKLDKLEVFHPDRMADRILGMGDVVSLVEKAQEHIDHEKAEEAAAKLLTNTFTLTDMLEQFRMVKKMGSMKSLLEMVPGMKKLTGGIEMPEDMDKQFGRMEAIIQSMTPRERTLPDLIDPSRRNRIARGSGTALADVNGLLKEFKQVRKMFQQLGGAGGAMPGGLGGKLAGKFLPGMPGGAKKAKQVQQLRKQGKLLDVADPSVLRDQMKQAEKKRKQDKRNRKQKAKQRRSNR